MATRSSTSKAASTRKTSARNASTTTKPKAATAKKATSKPTVARKATVTKATAKPPANVTAAAKAATGKKAPAKATPATVSKLEPVVSAPPLRKNELLEAVVKKSGTKRKDARPVVEAMLAVMGSALQDGRDLNLQPFGAVKINRERKRAEGKVLVARIRQARDLPTLDAVLEDAETSDAADTAKPAPTPTAAE